VSVASQQAGVGELTREFDADFDSPTQLRYVAPLLASLPSPLGGGRTLQLVPPQYVFISMWGMPASTNSSPKGVKPRRLYIPTLSSCEVR